MTFDQREAVGMLSAAVLIVLMCACTRGGDGPAPCLSHPVPAALAAPVLHEEPFEHAELSYDESVWRPEVTSPFAVSAATSLAPSRHHGLRKVIDDWIRDRRRNADLGRDPERVPEPPAPDCLRHSTQPLQIGIKF